jgi:hypothetical protein
LCAAVITFCMFSELPWLVHVFAPMAPTSAAYGSSPRR